MGTSKMRTCILADWLMGNFQTIFVDQVCILPISWCERMEKSMHKMTDSKYYGEDDGKDSGQRRQTDGEEGGKRTRTDGEDDVEDNRLR